MKLSLAYWLMEFTRANKRFPRALLASKHELENQRKIMKCMCGILFYGNLPILPHLNLSRDL